MNSCLDNEEKISAINGEEKNLLEMAKEKVLCDKEEISCDIVDLAAVIKKDKESIKKYSTILRTESLIEELVEEILDVRCHEDNVELKQKIDGYIESVKGELSRRGIEENTISKYDSMSNDIHNYIELLKDNYLYLLDDDNEESIAYSNDEAYIYQMVNKYKTKYNVKDPLDYSGSRIKDTFRLLRNMPTYSHNRKCVDRMHAHARLYYGGSDFVGYIAYLRRKNSIRLALKTIFNKSYFKSYEGTYLNDHEKCAEWIKAYCDSRNLELNYTRCK